MAKMSQAHPNRNYDVATKFRQPFEALRDNKMTEICRALLSRPDAKLDADWHSVSSFVGYAPVLAVVSEFLAVPNPHALVQPSALGNNPKSVLLSVIKDILDREQIKFQNQVINKLRAEMPADVEW